MRFFKDSDIEVSVRWFFCDPTAKLLGTYSRFSSGNWASQKDSWPGPGEVLGATREWSDGETPQWAQGQRHCGTDLQWAEGPSFDPTYNAMIGPDGQPACCGVSAPVVDCPVCSGQMFQSYWLHVTVKEGFFSFLADVIPFVFFDHFGTDCFFVSIPNGFVVQTISQQYPPGRLLLAWLQNPNFQFFNTGMDCGSQTFFWDVFLGADHLVCHLSPSP